VVAECKVEIATYADAKIYSSSGGEPYASDDPDFEEDCSSAGTVTVY
jgi:hypothetical protein